MGNQSRVKPKPRVDDVMAKLAKRKTQGEPAHDWLYRQLGGEDGEAEWTYEEAAQWARKKLGQKVGRSAVYNWFQKRAAAEKQERYIAVIREVEMRHLEANPDIDAANLANAVIGMAVGQIVSEENPEVATKVIQAMTQLKKATTEEAKLHQRIREYEESTSRLRQEMEQLRQKLERGGLGEGDAETHVRQVVDIVDRVMGTAPSK